MGIQGLLPLLKSSSRQANIKEFKGCTVAIDSYCWLHRGAFACAEKLAMGEPTDQYVFYCMKYVNNLLAANIKPVMVFDGCRLPSKKEVEKQRRERREMYRKKAAHFLREGNRNEARDCLSKCVDITPQMALELMNACRDKGVDCIVAPYEADAQLAFLSKTGIAQIIITEDSDLVLFGCERIMFKMDVNGNGVLIEQKDLPKAVKLRPDLYTFDKFRYMCIMSGCDYLPSLPGIGLGKASKVFQLTRQTDMTLVLKKMPSLLKMASLEVGPDYIDGFFRANNTFLYQLVYDPLKRKLVPLNPYPPDLDFSQLEYAGPYMDDEFAYQLAIGNIDVYTGEKIAAFDPDTFRPKSQRWDDCSKAPHQLSIWNLNYRPMLRDTFQTLQAKCTNSVPVNTNTNRKEIVVKLPQPAKRKCNSEIITLDDDRGGTQDDVSEADLDALYSGVPQVSKKFRVEFFNSQSTVLSSLDSANDSDIISTQSQPISECVSTSQADWETIANSYGSTDEPPEVCEQLEDVNASQTESKCESPSGSALRRSVDDVEIVMTSRKAETDDAALAMTSPSASSKPSRNMFAVSATKNTKAKPQFSLNISPKGAEVRSRFFMTQKPLQKTTFFKELTGNKEIDSKLSDSADKKRTVNGEFKPVRPSASILNDLRSSRLSQDKDEAEETQCVQTSDERKKLSAFVLFQRRKSANVDEVIERDSDCIILNEHERANENLRTDEFQSDIQCTSAESNTPPAKQLSQNTKADSQSRNSLSSPGINSAMGMFTYPTMLRGNQLQSNDQQDAKTKPTFKNTSSLQVGLRKPIQSQTNRGKLTTNNSSKRNQSANSKENNGLQQPTIMGLLSQYQFTRNPK